MTTPSTNAFENQTRTRYAEIVLKPPPDDQTPYPPALPPLAVIALTGISFGVFLWVWALMWGNYFKKVKPENRISALAYANIVPGALLYLNLPSLLLATRENDTTEIARLHIGIALWGTVAAVCLLVTGITIFITQRQLKASPQPVP